jgi:hypothetical protein
MRLIHTFLVGSLLVFLTSCGGGGGNPGSTGPGGGGTTPPPGSSTTAADFVFSVDKTSLSSTSNDVSTLTITALDAARNVVKDVPVSVSVDSGGIFRSTGAAVTDSAGVFTGTISFGSDRTNRALRVTMLVGGITKTTTINVAGTTETSANYIFELDKTILDNSGTDKAVLVVTALDPDRNVLSGVPVSVAVDSGGVFTRTGGVITDASGKFTGSIGIGSDKSNRTINATITVGGVSKIATIAVTGAAISTTLVSATPAPGEVVVFTATAKDRSGVGIAGATLTFGGTSGLTGSKVTDASGVASTSFAAPTASGNYTVTVNGLGISTARSLLVINTGDNSIPAATGIPSSISLSPVPTTVAPNLPNSSANRLRLSAKFLNSLNAGVENYRVRFEIVPPALGNGESISTGLGVVYSDASGTAIADYIPGTRSSPTNGVLVRACYKATDFTSTSDCPAFITANITVASNPLSISISTDNKITKGGGGIAYIKTYLIQVNDAAGVAVKDAVVSVSVDITHFAKGYFGNPGGSLAGQQNLLNPGLNTSVPSDSFVPTRPTAAVGATPAVPGVNVWCANEDKSRNAFLDAGEDRNGSGVLEPRKAEIIVSYKSGNRTDDKGQMLIETSHGQNVGTWLAYVLRATTGVDGTEGDASESFITDIALADVGDGSFLTPPYGSGACNQQN